MEWDNNLTVKGSESFEQPATGMHQAVCVFIHDIGTHLSEYQGKQIARHQIIVTWEIDETMTKGDYTGKRFNVSKFYTRSLNEKATLRKDLESWRGKAFSETELEGFDLKKLVGANCFLNLVETKSGKRAIASVSPLAKGMTAIKVEQLAPSERFMKWIETKRAESVEGQAGEQSAPPTSDENNNADSDLPF